MRELIRDGAIGELLSVPTPGATARSPRPATCPPRASRPRRSTTTCGSAPRPLHPYNPGYFAGGPGANCLSWNMYWDFGSGQVGDMGSHTMDLAWNAIDAGLPTSAEAKGEPFNPEVTPGRELTATFEHPANDWRGPIQRHLVPGRRHAAVAQAVRRPEQDRPRRDVQGHARASSSPTSTPASLVPFGDDADLTYYKPRTKDNGASRPWATSRSSGSTPARAT